MKTNNKILVLFSVLSTFGDASALDRIFGGQPTSINPYAYQVSIRSRENSHFCGGSIISDVWVLSAAHCFVGKTPLTILLVTGTNSLNSGGTSYSVSRIISHPDYNKVNNMNDIALLRIVGSIAFSNNVKPIQLSSEHPPVGASLVLTGWGLQSYPSSSLPNTLQHINLLAISNDLCKSILNGFPITANNVCTIQSKGKGACQGDSGGPLVYNGAQVGIVSWGIPCAKGYPDVFTSVASYLNWISSKTEIGR